MQQFHFLCSPHGLLLHPDKSIGWKIEEFPSQTQSQYPLSFLWNEIKENKKPNRSNSGYVYFVDLCGGVYLETEPTQDC